MRSKLRWAGLVCGNIKPFRATVHNFPGFFKRFFPLNCVQTKKNATRPYGDFHQAENSLNELGSSQSNLGDCAIGSLAEV